MTVELISVGTEILMGNIVNTNATYLSAECVKLGLNLYTQTVVGDNDGRLSEVFRTAFSRSDIVILTGGLGPTEDDLTKETVCKALDLKLVTDDKALEDMKAYFAAKGLKMTENNLKQAMVPENAIVMYNRNGTAPGIIAEKDGHAAILLPGPPKEMVPMFEEYGITYLEKKTDGVFYTATLKVCGIGESAIETELLDLIDEQSNPTIATYAKTNSCEIRITAKASTYESAHNLAKPLVKTVKKRLGNAVYSTLADEEMENSLFRLLRKYKLTISTAESCTGGLIAAKLVNVPGISEYFTQGYVTYTNKAKRKVLGVNRDTLKKYTAVSMETAKEMAVGALFAADTDIAISVTGYAGPDDTKEEPKGLVYIGVAIKGKIEVTECHFAGNRDKIRESAAISALNLTRLAILKYYDK